MEKRTGDELIQKIVSMQDTPYKKSYMQNVLATPFFRDNVSLLSFIAGLETTDQQYAIVLYTHDDRVEPEKMKKMREAIVEQPTWQGMSQIGRLIHSGELRDNKPLFEFIVKQKDWKVQEQLINALTNEKIRNDKDVLPLILIQDSGEEIKTMRMAALDKKIPQANSLERILVLRRISSQGDAERQRQILYAYEDDKTKYDSFALDLIEWQDSPEEMSEVRLYFKLEDRDINEIDSVLEYISSLSTEEEQKQARNHIRKRLMEALLEKKTGKKEVVEAAIFELKRMRHQVIDKSSKLTIDEGKREIVLARA